MMNLLDINWRMFPEERTRARGVWPNQLWHNNAERAGALVVPKSRRYAEYPVSKAGLEYVVDAVQSNRITTGFVGLRNGRGELAACKPVLIVASLLQQAPPRDGPFGQYWWVREDLTLDSRDGTSPYGRELAASDEMPF
jgi:hypothetical protein